MKSFRRRSPSGFSLVELLIVIGVISILIAGVFVFYPKVRLNKEVNLQVDNISFVVSTANDFFSGRETTGLDRDSAITAQLATDEQLTSPWGSISLAPVAGNQDWSMTYADVPSEACILLLSRVQNINRQITVGTTVVKSSTVAFEIGPMSEACNAADLVDITFIPVK